MKTFITLFLIAVSTSLFAQEDYYTKKGYAVEGYDVVAYFSNKAVEGKTEFTTTYDGIKYKFSTKENLELFTKSPKNYLPQYGGYCAYAIGAKAKKVSINPETFEIRDGKLYLFYNSWGTNTLTLWKEEGAAQLKEKADKNWLKIKN
jgi:YHS domain-containing protein